VPVAGFAPTGPAFGGFAQEARRSRVTPGRAAAGTLGGMSERTAATAPESPGGDHDGVVFFWRRGCGFCTSLRRGLEAAGVPLVEVDIWKDPRGAAAVRAITGGDETVPTVVVGDTPMVNPTAQQVLDEVARVAPGLLPG